MHPKFSVRHANHELSHNHRCSPARFTGFLAASVNQIIASCNTAGRATVQAATVGLGVLPLFGAWPLGSVLPYWHDSCL
jgi:hypothetical protein